jgi:hypothetical protein
MAAFFGNMARNYGMNKPGTLFTLQMCSVLFFNILPPIFGKEKQALLHLPTQSKMYNYLFNK